MESLKLSFEAVLPIFMLMLLGYFLKRIKMADKKTFDSVNKIIFRVFLPTLLFYDIYKTNTAGLFDGKLVAFAIIGTICVYLIGFAIVMLVTKDNSKRGVILQCFFRSNYAILGIPLIKYICGDGSGGISSIMVAVVIPTFNVLAVICLEIFRGNTINFKKIILGILKNPLIIGCALGAVFNVCHIALPEIIDKTVADISEISSPLAIIVLGASFEFSDIKGYFKENLIAVSARLVFVPMVMLSLGALMGFTGEAFACLIVIFGAPVAVSSFSMAQQMGGDEKLASQVVVLSSAFCIFTLFVWIFIYDFIGII